MAGDGRAGPGSTVFGENISTWDWVEGLFCPGDDLEQCTITPSPADTIPPYRYIGEAKKYTLAKSVIKIAVFFPSKFNVRVNLRGEL